MSFRKDFIWGVSSSAYQIEGAAESDGKGLSVWDIFCNEKKHVYKDQTGDVACDHYHLYKDDIAIMSGLGIKAYRFSISWPRIIPAGTGEINEKGVRYYDDLIDEMMKKGIEPYITLHHWDLPYELQKKGGWLNPESPRWFYEYASFVAEHFSDRVKNYITFNEPQIIAEIGNWTGNYAPGLNVGKYEIFEIWNNLLKAHGMAVTALREKSKQPVKVGFAVTGTACYPATEKPSDIQAAKEKMFCYTEDVPETIYNMSFWGDPIFKGKYPDELDASLRKYIPENSEEDWKCITQPLDFWGINIYNGKEVAMDENGVPAFVEKYEGFPRTSYNWPVTPECVRWAVKYLYERYQVPIIITESGMSCLDWVALDGKVHDPQRIDFLHRYLLQCKQAVDEGVDIRGYFQWCLLDDFEWDRGFTERFGMVYVDFVTKKRYIKDSAYFYSNIIKSNGENL